MRQVLGCVIGLVCFVSVILFAWKVINGKHSQVIPNVLNRPPGESGSASVTTGSGTTSTNRSYTPKVN